MKKHKKTIVEQIYEVFEEWKSSNKMDKEYCDMFVGFIVDDELMIRHKDFYAYWESLKKNYNLEQLKRDCKELQKRNGKKEAQNQHELNELHRGCRDIESLIRAGYMPQEAYRIVKSRYRGGK